MRILTIKWKKKKKETQSFGVRRNYDNMKSTLSEFLAQQKQEKKKISVKLFRKCM